MGVKHAFVSSVPDIGGPTYVQPTHWNSPHNMPPVVVWDFDPGVVVPSFGVPSTAGPTGFEFPNNTPMLRGRYDFTYLDNIYIAAGVASQGLGASSAFRLQYSPSGFPGSWYSFDATAGSGPFVGLASNTNASVWLLGSNGMVWGPTAPVGAAAKALPQPLSIRLAAYGGNGSAIGLGKIDVLGF